MKKLNVIVAAFAVVGVFATANSLVTRAFAQERGETEAPSSGKMTKPVGKITPWAAMKIAERKTGGLAFQALYEFDEGNWSYGVGVVKNHKLMEVEINPTTGKIGDTEAIDPAGEAKEVQQELSAAMKLGK